MFHYKGTDEEEKPLSKTVEDVNLRMNFVEGVCSVAQFFVQWGNVMNDWPELGCVFLFRVAVLWLSVVSVALMCSNWNDTLHSLDLIQYNNEVCCSCNRVRCRNIVVSLMQICFCASRLVSLAFAMSWTDSFCEFLLFLLGFNIGILLQNCVIVLLLKCCFKTNPFQDGWYLIGGFDSFMLVIPFYIIFKTPAKRTENQHTDWVSFRFSVFGSLFGLICLQAGLLTYFWLDTLSRFDASLLQNLTTISPFDITTAVAPTTTSPLWSSALVKPPPFMIRVLLVLIVGVGQGLGFVLFLIYKCKLVDEPWSLCCCRSDPPAHVELEEPSQNDVIDVPPHGEDVPPQGEPSTSHQNTDDNLFLLDNQ